MKKTSFALASVLLAGSLFALTACDEGGGSVGKVNGNFRTEATAQEVETALNSIELEKAFGTGDTVALQMLAELEVSVKADGMNNKTDLSFDYALQGPKALFGVEAAPAAEEEIDSQTSWKEYAAAALEQFVGKGSFSVNTKQTVSGQSLTSTVGADIYQDATSIYFNLNMNGYPQKGKVSISELLDLIDESMEPEYPEDEIISGSDTETDVPLVPSEGEDFEIMSPAEILETIREAGFKTYIDDSNGLKIKFKGDSQIILDAFEDAGMSIDASMLKSSVYDVYLAFDENGLFSQLGVDLDVQVNVEGTKMTVKGGMALKSYSETVTLPLGIALDPTYLPISLKEIAGGSNPIL